MYSALLRDPITGCAKRKRSAPSVPARRLATSTLSPRLLEGHRHSLAINPCFLLTARTDCFQPVPHPPPHSLGWRAPHGLAAVSPTHVRTLEESGGADSLRVPRAAASSRLPARRRAVSAIPTRHAKQGEKNGEEEGKRERRPEASMPV